MIIDSRHNIHPGTNRVLVKIPRGNTTIELCGMKLDIDISFDPGRHVDVYGEVAAVPDGLHYKKIRNSLFRGSMTHKVQNMELEVGDKIYFLYFAAIMALGYMADFTKMPYHEDNAYFICKDEVYILIPYESIFVAVRGEQIIPLNGYALVEPIMFNEYDVDFIKNMREHENVGIVRYIGNHNLEYNEKRMKDAVDIKPGDTILFRRFNNQCLENDLHQSFPHKGHLFKMQRRFICAKIINSTIK